MKFNFYNIQKNLSVLYLTVCLLIFPVDVRPQRKAVSSDTVNSLPKARTALIIGNSKYVSIPLRNPVNDARLIEDSLKSIGFQTTIKENLNLAEMKTAIRNFAAQLPSGGVGLIYYAGHGIQITGRNFLIPTDFSLAENDVAKQSLEVDELLQSVSGKNGLNIVILDACRNAPPGFTASAKSGLAEIRNAPIGTYIAFSTAPGRTAQDGTGENSPYAEALAANLRLRPSRLEDVFIRTRIQVDAQTGGKQTPWENSSIRSTFYFTEDTFAENAPASIAPIISNSLGKLLNFPVVVPVLNETGRQISTVNKTISAFTDNASGLEMAQVRGGNFLMGTDWTEIEKAYGDAVNSGDQLTRETIAAEMPQHQVNINGFFMSRYEITQGQWQSVMGTLPSDIPQNFRAANFPVIGVSWRQANDFCQKLSLLTGKTYRLPTEAEWEYAAKAGTDAPFGFGKSINSNLANFMATVPYRSLGKGEYRQTLVAVGSLRAFNNFGLADMHGNVWEWTADNWSDDYDNTPTDGSAWETDDDYRLYRVIRGGSWDSTGNNCRSTARRKQPQSVGSSKIGFRVVMQ